MIDFERLTFPGGVAVATVLKSPGAGVHKAILLLLGIGLSATVSIVSHVTKLEDLPLGRYIGLPILRTASGSFSADDRRGLHRGSGRFRLHHRRLRRHWILGPIRRGWACCRRRSSSPIRRGHPEYMRLHLFGRWELECWSVGRSWYRLALPLIVNAVRSMHDAARTRTGLSKDEMPVRFLYFGIAAAVLVLSIVAVYSVEGMGILRGILMALVGTLWIWMAGVILSECIGRTNWSPLSGMTLIG
jgi:hypothetical protein